MSDAPPLTPSERRAYKLGRRSFERGDDDTALEQLRRLLRTRQGFADVHYMLGVLLERRNEMAAAARCLTRALRLNPDYAEARLALASLYERQGDYERSREITEHARARSAGPDGALDPTTRGKLANLQAALGDAYREAGELREAIEAYRKALDRCPDFHDIRLRLGIALREAGLPNTARWPSSTGSSATAPSGSTRPCRPASPSTPWGARRTPAASGRPSCSRSRDAGTRRCICASSAPAERPSSAP